MWTDALLQFSSAQAVTASAVSTNTVDLGAINGDSIRNGVEIGFTVDTTITAAGAATVTLQVISSASGSLSAPTVLVQSDAIGKAELTAGRRTICLQVPPHVLGSLPFGQRYLGVQYVVGTGPLTAGAFTANLITNRQGGAGVLYPQNRAVY